MGEGIFVQENQRTGYKIQMTILYLGVIEQVITMIKENVL